MLSRKTKTSMYMVHSCPDCIATLCIDQEAAILDRYFQRPAKENSDSQGPRSGLQDVSDWSCKAER